VLLLSRTMPVETEIKLRLPGGAEPARALLQSRGFAETSPRTLEADDVYDLPDQALRHSGRLLRLRRRGDTWTLTYKGPPQPGRHKSREEIETTLADGAALAAILEALGYRRTFRYEKFRTKFKSAGKVDRMQYGPPGGVGEITLDETPIGSFLELEGPEYWIDETAANLGFHPEHYVTKSYGALYHDHLMANPDAPPNMTF